MDRVVDCCRYEPSLEDLLADDIMSPVLKSAGVDRDRVRELMVETARRVEQRRGGHRRQGFE